MPSLKAHHYLIAILGVVLVTAVSAGCLHGGDHGIRTSIYALSAFPVYVLIYLWMKSDARSRSSVAPSGAIPLIPVLLPLAVPYYLLRTRKNWQKLSAFCLLIVYLLLMLVLIQGGESLGSWLVT